MRKIRVTVGTVGYYDAKHAHKRMTAADGPFECEDTQAEHFVSAGVAEYVGDAIEVDEADEQEVTGHLAKSQLEEMTIQQLQNLGGADARNDKAAVRQRFDIAVVDQPAERLLDRCAADLDLLTDLPDGQGIAGRIVAVHDLFQQSIIHIFRLARCFGKNLQSTHLKLPQS